MFSLMPFRKERKPERALAPLDLFRRDFAKLFDRAFGSRPMAFETLWGWEWTEPYGLAMEEKEGKVMVRAELPGFEAKELEIKLTGNVLTILAEHKEDPPKEKEAEKPIEHRYGRVERTVSLPVGVVPEKIEAVFRNGVLELTIPPAPEFLPKRIEVKT